MRVWDAIASQTKPVRVYETPFIADVRLFAEATLRRGGASLYVARDDRHAMMAACGGAVLRAAARRGEPAGVGLPAL